LGGGGGGGAAAGLRPGEPEGGGGEGGVGKAGTPAAEHALWSVGALKVGSGGSHVALRARSKQRTATLQAARAERPSRG